MGQVAELTEVQLATIDWVLKRYRDAQDRTEGHIEAVADIAPDLDGWLRSLLEVVKGYKVTWIPCEERTPDTDRYVWAAPVLEDCCPVVYYLADQWWIDDRPLSGSGVTRWAEIRLPEPPQLRGGDACGGRVCSPHRKTTG